MGRDGYGKNQRFCGRAVWYAKFQSCEQAMGFVSDGEWRSARAHTRFLSLGRTKAHVSDRNVAKALYEHKLELKGATPDPLPTQTRSGRIRTRRGSFSCSGLACELAQFGWCSTAESSKSFQEPQPSFFLVTKQQVKRNSKPVAGTLFGHGSLCTMSRYAVVAHRAASHTVSGHFTPPCSDWLPCAQTGTAGTRKPPSGAIETPCCVIAMSKAMQHPGPIAKNKGVSR